MATSSTLAGPGRPAPDANANRTVLSVLEGTSPLYWLGVGVGAVVFGVAQGVFLYQTYTGLGIAGYQAPIFWGIYIVTFVFWVGIAHAGTLISAILYLFRAKWRNAINRLAEAMTVIAVLTAFQFLGFHVGRIWRSHFILPYPNQRGLWVNFKSPLVWDTFAISTYALVSMMFLYVGLLPDLAVARDRASGWRKPFYTFLALGWRGSSRQWKAHHRTVLHLSGLATPLVLSVHSVVSFDFAMAVVPGWHGTIFPPYFVAGAIFSGFALVITVLIPLRRIYGLESIITERHFDQMGKFLLLTSCILGYAYLCEYAIAWYSGVEFEQTSFWLRLTGPYWIATWIMIVCNVVLPHALWSRRVRTHLPTLFALSIAINVGMWFERYVIIMTGLSREYVPGAWGLYIPSLPELAILVGSFGFFGLCLLVFLKLLPAVAIAEVKELEIEARAAKR
ncbi:MAG: polysulfide reductase NrfD [Proteobacteria bacterium]|nr:polysulfide reductase NrfD [Pseudomonadota bacterium]